MVNDSQAKLIAKEVQKRYSMGMQAVVVSADNLVGDGTNNNENKAWNRINDVPPSYFDFSKIYLVNPNQNWAEWNQINADNGKPGISKTFCFFLVAHEFGHKMFAPVNPMIAMQEKAILEMANKGWGDKIRSYMDDMIVNVGNLRSAFVSNAFKDYPGLIANQMKNIYGPFLLRNKRTAKGGHYQTRKDITDWWEVVCRLMIAHAESEFPGKSPTQDDSTGSPGILWPGLKESPRAKEQMEICFKMYNMLNDIQKNATEGDWEKFLMNYEMLANSLTDILGDFSDRIYAPPPVSLGNKMIPGIKGIGPLKTFNEAAVFLNKLQDIRDRVKDEIKLAGGTP